MVQDEPTDGQTDGQTEGQTDGQKKWYIEVGAPPKKQLTKDFSIICDWLADDKLSMYLEDKMKSILFSSKRNLKLVEELDMR